MGITDIQSFLPFHSTQRNVRILAVVLLSAVETQWRWWCRAAGVRTLSVACTITFVTQSCVVTTDLRQRRHCLESYRVKREAIVWSCQWLCRRSPLVSRSYVIVLCLQSTDMWHRRFYAVDGIDWALTHLMWLVQTYLDRPTIFHINLLNLARSRCPSPIVWLVDRHCRPVINTVMHPAALA